MVLDPAACSLLLQWFWTLLQMPLLMQLKPKYRLLRTILLGRSTGTCQCTHSSCMPSFYQPAAPPPSSTSAAYCRTSFYPATNTLMTCYHSCIHIKLQTFEHAAQHVEYSSLFERENPESMTMHACVAALAMPAHDMLKLHILPICRQDLRDIIVPAKDEPRVTAQASPRLD